jgi:DNA primase
MASQREIIEFIENAFGTGTLSNGGLNISVVCPICAERQDNLQKRKLVIRTDDFLTHCWVCGYRSTNLVNLLSAYHPALLPEYKKKFRIKARERKLCNFTETIKLLAEGKEPVKKELNPALTLPAGFKMLALDLKPKDGITRRALQYLFKRGLTEADLWRWKIGIATTPPGEGEQDFRYRVIVPSFDSMGKLNFFVGRAFLPGWKGPPYSNPPLKREELVFNELNIDWTKELTLVEGVFDMIKANDNTTCILGSSFDSSYKLFQEIVRHQTPVLLALDPDAKGKALKAAKALLEYGVTVRFLELPPGIKDVGELKKGEFNTYSERAKLMTMEDFFQMKLRE